MITLPEIGSGEEREFEKEFEEALNKKEDTYAT